MPTRKTLQLDEDSRAQLQRVVKRGSNWRERKRAQTLLLDSGLWALGSLPKMWRLRWV